jgi:hypothetical protein
VSDQNVTNVHIEDAKIDELVEMLPTVVKESKAGWKTTEFWVTIGGSLLVFVNGIPMPEKLEPYFVGAVGVAYIISRGIAKKGVPVIEESKGA